MKKAGFLIVTFLLSLTLVYAQDQNMDQNRVNEDVQEFVKKAASGGKMEVELGKLAQEKGQHQEVKDFGSRMEQDHSKANEELMQIASQMNIELQEDMKEDQQENVNELRDINTNEDKYAFDKEYMALMVEDHKEDIELFENALENVNDDQLRGWIESTLETLRQHLQLAEQTKQHVDNWEEKSDDTQY